MSTVGTPRSFADPFTPSSTPKFKNSIDSPRGLFSPCDSIYKNMNQNPNTPCQYKNIGDETENGSNRSETTFIPLKLQPVPKKRPKRKKTTDSNKKPSLTKSIEEQPLMATIDENGNCTI